MLWVFYISLPLGFCSRRFLLCNASLGSGWFSDRKGFFSAFGGVYPSQGVGGRHRGGVDPRCLPHAQTQRG